MLNLPRPTSWYFDTCRQIVWCRLSFDKLFVLYSGNARHDLETIWRAAISRTLCGGALLDAASVLDERLQSDDREWRELVQAVAAVVDIEQAVADYFLGDDVATVVTDIEGGGYRGN